MFKNKILMLPVQTDSGVLEFTTDSEFQLDAFRLTLTADTGETLPISIKEHSFVLRNKLGGRTVFVNLREDLSDEDVRFMSRFGSLHTQK